MRLIFFILAVALSTCGAEAQSTRVFQPLYQFDSAFPRASYCQFDTGEEGFGFASLSTGMSPFNLFTSGGSVAQAVPVTGYKGVTTVGLAQLQTSTGTTDRMGVGTSTNLMKIGVDATSFLAYGQETTVSDVNSVTTVRLGYFDSFIATPANGAFFRYLYSTNSGKWQAVTRQGGTETATDTGITFTASTFREYRIDINAAGTSVDFWIDGTKVVAGQSTNIPSGTQYVGVGWTAIRASGATGTFVPMRMDYIGWKTTFTTPRC